MTDQEKALVKRDLMLCLKINAKLGDYQNLNAVQKIYNWIGMESRFQTVIGKRYVKRLGEVLEGETDFVDCVLCNGLMMDGTAVCADCLQKYRNLIPQPTGQQIQAESGTVQKMTAISRQAADTARQMSVTARENLNTMSARISEFTEENETVNAAKGKLKGMADSGMEKLQNNPEVAKAMEKGKEQAKKAQGKWRRMSRKKRIVVAVVCVVLFLGAIGGTSSSGEDLIDMVGLTEEQGWKEFGKPDRREDKGAGISTGYYKEGFYYLTYLDGVIFNVFLTDGNSKILGISLGDSETELEKVIKKEKLSIQGQNKVQTEDGRQALVNTYKNADYTIWVYLDDDYKVIQIVAFDNDYM